MLTSVATTSINHVLRSERWACKRLQSFMGKTICVQIPPLVNFRMCIDPEGEVRPVDHSVGSDATLVLLPAGLPGLFSQDVAALKLINITGDKSFAEALIDIGKQINFSVIFEHDLSRIIGDIPAHRVAHAREHIVQWQAENAHRISQTFVEYCTEENVFLTKATAINQFIQDVKTLQRSTEQLEQRLDRLIQHKVP